MIIAFAIVAYLLATVGFARHFRRSHPELPWVPVFVASLGWPYLSAIRLVALFRHHLMGQ
jgi:hypothetical protein